MKKRALISVFYKEGIIELASVLNESGWEIISTGGTSKYLKENKIPVTDVSTVTGFPECLDGRVKTLHPAIHAGILARRDLDDHTKTLDKLDIKTIDLVCVNLYPFFEKAQEELQFFELIEFIDIGGPAMLRSAAKNFNSVIVLCDPDDYIKAIEGIKSDNFSMEFKKHLAGKVFSLTSAYDAAIADFLLEEKYPVFMQLPLKKYQSLRYGENSHQSAALYLYANAKGAIAGMEQLHGKELGYNNIRDLDLAWKAACTHGINQDGILPMGEEDVKRLVPQAAALKNTVCCAAVKHNTPCGIALGSNLLDAYNKTYLCDPVSIYGGIIAVTTIMDAATAEKLNELFLEIVAAPDYDPKALDILKKKKNLRIIKAKYAPAKPMEFVSVDGGILVQDTDKKLLEKWEVVTEMPVSPIDIQDLIFGMRAVTFVKSNAIMTVKNLAATGIGGGQVNRIWAAKQALKRSASVLDGSEQARVLASDAFFPFPDVVEAAAEYGIKAIIQPGGSVNDKDSIRACDKYGIAMVFTGTRHFKH